jgi:serine/threonine protein phosphatase PrpC
MLEAFGLSDPGCVRSNNEDYYLLAPALGLFLVADGMGGAAAGECASQLAAETVGEYVWRTGKCDVNLLPNAFAEANRRVLEEASRDSALDGMGTTLVAVLDAGSELFISSVGDSRAYVFHNNALTPLTEDQTWVQEVGRKLGIEEAQLKVHPMRHVLTMAIGVSEQLRVHSYRVELSAATQILLCSDGLHGVVPDEEIERVFQTQTALEDKGKTLIEAAKKAGAPDNVTAVLLRVVSLGEAPLAPVAAAQNTTE